MKKIREFVGRNKETISADIAALGVGILVAHIYKVGFNKGSQIGLLNGMSMLYADLDGSCEVAEKVFSKCSEKSLKDWISNGNQLVKHYKGSA